MQTYNSDTDEFVELRPLTRRDKVFFSFVALLVTYFNVAGIVWTAGVIVDWFNS